MPCRAASRGRRSNGDNGAGSQVTAHELLILNLAVYANSRKGMPVHQAAGIARPVVDNLPDSATALEALAAFDKALKDFLGG